MLRCSCYECRRAHFGQGESPGLCRQPGTIAIATQVQLNQMAKRTRRGRTNDRSNAIRCLGVGQVSELAENAVDQNAAAGHWLFPSTRSD